MKTIKLPILALTVLVSNLTCANIEIGNRADGNLRIKLIDANTLSPLTNFEIGINTDERGKEIKMQSMYNGHAKIYYKSYFSDKKGQLYIPKKELTEKLVNHIFIPSTKMSMKIIKTGENQLITPIFRCGFGYSQRIGASQYDLTSNNSSRINLLEMDTTSVNENIFELVVCPDKTRNKSRLFVNSLDVNHYLDNQYDLWATTFDHFKNEVGDDLDLHPNSEIWFQYTVGIMHHFGVKNLNLATLIEVLRNRDKPVEKYNLLVSLFKIRFHHISTNLEPKESEEKRIKALYEEFYSKNKEFINKVNSNKSYRDNLMNQIKKSDYLLSDNGNMTHRPNSFKRIKILE